MSKWLVYLREDKHMRTEQNRIYALDGLRAFAIISVMLCHSSLFFMPIDLSIGSIHFENLLYNGWSGVDLFFVLSGFLITSQLLEKKFSPQSIKKFYIKRFFRIAPAYYTVLLFITPIRALSKFSPDTFSIADWMVSGLLYYLFLQDFISTPEKIDDVFWSIPVEIHFYMLCPILIYFLCKIDKTYIQIASITVFFILYLTFKYISAIQIFEYQFIPFDLYFENFYSKFHYSLDGLLGGFFCSFLWHNKKISHFLSLHFIPYTLILTGLLIYILLSFPEKIKQEMILPLEFISISALYALAFCFILLGVIGGNNQVSKILSHPILRVIATLSYCLYLTHFLTYIFQEKALLYIFSITNNLTLSWILSLPFYFGLSFCLAYLLHIFIEKPCIEWSKTRWNDKK